jgi:hypothetical protein
MWCGTWVPSDGTTSQLDQGVQHRVVGDLSRARRAMVHACCERASSAYPAYWAPVHPAVEKGADRERYARKVR